MTEATEVAEVEEPIPEESTAGSSTDPPATAPETEEPVDPVDPPDSVTDTPEEPAPKAKAKISEAKLKATPKAQGGQLEHEIKQSLRLLLKESLRRLLRSLFFRM